MSTEKWRTLEIVYEDIDILPALSGTHWQAHMWCMLPYIQKMHVKHRHTDKYLKAKQNKTKQKVYNSLDFKILNKIKSVKS